MAESRATFDDVLRAASPALQPVCAALRKRIASLDPAFVEVVWPKLRIASYGVGPKKTSQHYAYIAVQAKNVNLGFYHGASLPDPSGLLEGSGKALRHVKILDLDAARRPAVVSLLRAAIADRKPHVPEVQRRSHASRASRRGDNPRQGSVRERRSP